MQPTTSTTENEARQQAIDWQLWQSEQSLSYGELIEWQNHFKRITEQWPDLKDEFIENGII